MILSSIFDWSQSLSVDKDFTTIASQEACDTNFITKGLSTKNDFIFHKRKSYTKSHLETILESLVSFQKKNYNIHIQHLKVVPDLLQNWPLVG